MLRDVFCKVMTVSGMQTVFTARAAQARKTAPTGFLDGHVRRKSTTIPVTVSIAFRDDDFRKIARFPRLDPHPPHSPSAPRACRGGAFLNP